MKHLYLLAIVVALGLTNAASAAPTTAAPRSDGAAAATTHGLDVAVLTGRWKLFFGSKICWGQVVNLPGESQCV